ncbi:NYN domain-containing protein [Aestuariimicrobium sp. Y1814]|uniref:NYN domain-containing protein n=1 Tax=Aestuariimicrobium sp. Y1814 TaxID=3418742 RepID=UPI003DA73B4A
MTQRTTYLLVDGENIDATLGASILQRRPTPAERPRWERLLNHLRDAWDQPVTGLFFLAASSGELPLPFVQALTAIGYRPVPLSGAPDQKVVDIAIQRTLGALLSRDADVVLASHDRDFQTDLEALIDGRRVGLVGFEELFSAGLRDLQQQGVQLFDLETHVGAFNEKLPRLRIVPIDEFDPNDYL